MFIYHRLYFPADNQKRYNARPYLPLLEHLRGSFSSTDNRSEISGSKPRASLISPDIANLLLRVAIPIYTLTLAPRHATFISKPSVPTYHDDGRTFSHAFIHITFLSLVLIPWISYSRNTGMPSAWAPLPKCCLAAMWGWATLQNAI